MAETEVSHGRGGAGNIAVDDTQYVDGEVVRTGVAGSHGDGAFSAGRGGAGNIADVGTKPTFRKDLDVVPDEAVVRTSEGDSHTGRGGAGNVDKEEEKETTKKVTPPKEEQPEAEGNPVGLADKLKGKLFGAFKK